MAARTHSRISCKNHLTTTSISDYQKEVDWVREYKTIFNTEPSQAELEHIRAVHRDSCTASPRSVRQYIQRKELYDAKSKPSQRKACGGVLRAEKNKYPSVFIKGIEYVPLTSSWDVRDYSTKTMLEAYAELFVWGNKPWCEPWVNELLYIAHKTSVYKLDKFYQWLPACRKLSPTERAQFILNKRMAVEFEEETNNARQRNLSALWAEFKDTVFKFNVDPVLIHWLPTHHIQKDTKLIVVKEREKQCTGAQKKP